MVLMVEKVLKKESATQLIDMKRLIINIWKKMIKI